jgi:hypothetical protein
VEDEAAGDDLGRLLHFLESKSGLEDAETPFDDAKRTLHRHPGPGVSRVEAGLLRGELPKKRGYTPWIHRIARIGKEDCTREWAVLVFFESRPETTGLQNTVVMATAWLIRVNVQESVVRTAAGNHVEGMRMVAVHKTELIF